MTNGTVHLGQDSAGFGLVWVTWAGLSGLVAHSLDRGALAVGTLGGNTGHAGGEVGGGWRLEHHDSGREQFEAHRGQGTHRKRPSTAVAVQAQGNGDGGGIRWAWRLAHGLGRSMGSV
jgi:hypothetical protein